MLLTITFLPTNKSFVVDQKLNLCAMLPNMKLFALIKSKDKPNGVSKDLEIF
jgi:hypothetical protein